MKKEFGETILHQFWNNDHGFWGGYRGGDSCDHLALHQPQISYQHQTIETCSDI